MKTMPPALELWVNGLLWIFIWYNTYDHCTGRWRLFWPWFGLLTFISINPF